MAIKEINLAGLARVRRHQEVRQQRSQTSNRASAPEKQSPQRIEWRAFETSDERIYDFNRNQGVWRGASRHAFDKEKVISRVRNLPHLGRRSFVDFLVRLRNRPSRARRE